MKLLFKKHAHFLTYHDNPVWTDGTVREVDDERAAILLKDFPLNFSAYEETASTEEPAKEEPTSEAPATSEPPSKTEETASTEEPIVAVLDADLAKTFIAAGFTTPQSVLAAKPEEIMEKTKISPKTLRKVQESCHRAVAPDKNKQIGPTENR